jgi:transcription antitermination factor NusG
MVADASAPAASSNPDLRWYIVHAYSGMEKAVERNILERIGRAGMQDKFGRILVPTEEVVEMKNGQRKTTERRLFPGYVFVEMVMDDDTWHLVKHTNKVTGFVGGAKNRPAPISEEEVQKSSARCRKALTSHATRSNSWWVSWFASKKAHSPTSMVRWKRSITRRIVCACR